MRQTYAILLAVLLAACGGSQSNDEPPTAEAMGMTPEEHAQMAMGGTSGNMDSTGQVVRQAVHLTPAEERALGVVYLTVGREDLTRTIRTVGQIAAPEPMIADVTPKVDGFIERLFVDYTGQSVHRGDPLLEIYSPAMVAAQEELLTARRMLARVDSAAAPEAWNNANAMLDAARRRLAYWDITEPQIAQIEQTGQVTKTLTLVAPVSGIVLDKQVVEGQHVMSGARLYRIADLTQVWVEGDVFEQDLQYVTIGSQAHIEVSAYSGRHIMGRVSFVYPTVDERSRTNRVRVTVPNPSLRLKPGMFATIYFDAHIGSDAIAVPLDAVIVTGERNLVFVRDAMGMLQPHQVVLGGRAGDRVQVLAGLNDGDVIVGSANFLVDAESRLASTGGGMPGMAHGAMEPEGTQGTTMDMEHHHD
jgi:membrane fusion protein, copper/silver efflux system